VNVGVYVGVSEDIVFVDVTDGVKVLVAVLVGVLVGVAVFV
jgi:hypothetical protein